MLLLAQKETRSSCLGGAMKHHDLVEAHGYISNEQHSHFRAIYVAILQYEAGRLDPKSLSTAVSVSLYSAVEKTFGLKRPASF